MARKKMRERGRMKKRKRWKVETERKSGEERKKAKDRAEGVGGKREEERKNKVGRNKFVCLCLRVFLNEKRYQ